MRLVVPARVAHLLRREPALAAPAVEAFHYRGVDDMRVGGWAGCEWWWWWWSGGRAGGRVVGGGGGGAAPALAAIRASPGTWHCSRLLFPGCWWSHALAPLLVPKAGPPKQTSGPPLPSRPLQAAARMAHFPPAGMVALRASLSRCLYAQLALQELRALRAYPMPLPSEPQVGARFSVGFVCLRACSAFSLNDLSVYVASCGGDAFGNVFVGSWCVWVGAAAAMTSAVEGGQ